MVFEQFWKNTCLQENEAEIAMFWVHLLHMTNSVRWTDAGKLFYFIVGTTVNNLIINNKLMIVVNV